MTDEYTKLSKYEISLWEDTPDTRDGVEIFKENRLFVIGSDLMDTPNAVFSPKLTKNVNGSKTLEFSIHSRYLNENSGEMIDNPFISYLVNERKIKLWYHDEWYDFLIKDISEGSDEFTFVYTCEDIFINELSKIGFALQFDTELENNQGSITQLAEKILADTDWEVDYENSDTIQQTKDEPLYDLLITSVTKNGNKVTTFPAYNTKTLLSQDINVVYEGESTWYNHFYVIYSSSTDADPSTSPSHKFFQFICKDGKDTFTVDDDRVITDADDLVLYNVDVVKDTTRKIITQLSWSVGSGKDKDEYVITFDSVNSNGLIYNFKGKRLVRNQLSTYDTVYDKMVNIYDRAESDPEGFKHCADTYQEVTITVDAFNSNKLRYWTLQSGQYVQCTEDSVFDETETYYIRIVVEYNKEWDYYIKSGSSYIAQQKIDPTAKNYISKEIYDASRSTYYYRIVYYGYTESDYISPIILGDLLGNDDCLTLLTDTDRKMGITSISGWQPVSGDTVEQNMYPQYNYNDENRINWTPTTGSVIFHPHAANSPILNSKVTGNSIFATYQKSHQLTLRLNLYKAEGKYYTTASSSDYSTTADIPTQKWYIYGDALDLTTNILKAYIGFYKIDEFGNIVQVEYSGESELYTFDTFRAGNDGLYYSDATCKMSLSEQWVSEMMSGLTDSIQIGFFIEINGTDYYLSDAMQLYEYQTVDERQIVPGETPEAKAITWYCYYPYDATIIEEKDVVLEYRATIDSDTYIPRYSTQYEKVRSIEGSESNCFNLIQSLCEVFECWARFNIWHNPTTGEIDRDTEDNYIAPIKKVSFNEYVGKDNDAGFVYGINLQSIERTVASDEIVTKLIVKENTNDYATDGYCTIARSDVNPTKQNFIFNFDYYTNKKLLNGTQVYNDLYEVYGDYLGYYPKMKEISEEELDLISQSANISVDMISLEANLETSYTVYNSSLEVYSSYQNEIGVQYGITYEQLKDTESIEDETVKAEIQNLLKTDSNLRQRLAEIETALQKYTTYQGRYQNYQTSRNSLKQKLAGITDKLESVKLQKSTLNKEFFTKYSRFIQEGTWTEDSYIDDTLYYYDAEALLYTSAYPKIEYNISVIDVRDLDGYELYDFDVGDKTFMQDTEFFGYTSRESNEPWTPRKQEVVVSEVTWVLDNPIENSITVQNYKSEFEDLFQTMTATVQSVDYAKGSYDRAASTVVNGTFDLGVFQETLDENSISIVNPKNKAVVFDEDGITLKDLNDAEKVVRLTSGGIYISSDKGNTWGAALTGEGINTSMLTSGNINTDNITIGGVKNHTFSWDKYGLSAYDFTFDTTDKTKIKSVDYTKFIRFDRFGIYGINNVSSTKWMPQTSAEVVSKAFFSLTWDGLRIKSSRKGDLGGILISTRTADNSDIQVLGSTGNTKLEIGYIPATNNYGLRVYDDAGNAVFYFDDDGDLVVEGTICAGAGQIGGFTIANQNLVAGDTKKVVISPSGISLGTNSTTTFTTLSEFSVDNNGYLIAQNANILGKLTTSVFEKASTRVVGGGSIYKNAEIIDTSRTTQGSKDVYLKNDEGFTSTGHDTFNVGDYVGVINSKNTRESSSNTEKYYKITNIDTANKKLTLNQVISSIPSDEEVLLIQIQEVNSEDSWIIGVNSTDEKRAFNMMKNSITFNTITYNDNSTISLTPKIVLGDLSGVVEGLSSGLYAENAYLTGEFYANKSSANSISINDEGFNLGDALVYDTESGNLDINATSITIGNQDLLYSIEVFSREGTTFKTQTYSTVLSATVYKAGIDITENLPAGLVIQWYKDNVKIEGATGSIYEIVNSSDELATYMARLEDSSQAYIADRFIANNTGFEVLDPVYS